MSFYSRYELVKLVRNGEPKSFQAREIQTGRNILLHLWGTGDESRRSPLLLRLRDQMKADPAALLGVVIEVQESAEPPYVATTFDEQFTDLEEWIGSRVNGTTEPAPPTAAKTDPGEFTRMFAHPPGTEPAAPAVPPPPAKPASEPGEFTRLFDTPLGGAEPPKPPAFPPAAPIAPAQPIAPPPPPARAPGEFTRMFGSPVAQPVSPAAQPTLQQQPPTRPPVPHQPAQAQEGDFARFFGSPLGANPLPVEEIERGAVAPPPSDPAGRPFSGPGDFTIQFGKEHQASAPGQPPAPPAHSPLPAGATGLFNNPEGDGTPPQAQPVRPAGPSEFTRVLQGPHLQEAGNLPPALPYQAPPMPGAVPVPAPPAKSNVLGILVAVLSFLLILLLIAVVVLVLKK